MKVISRFFLGVGWLFAMAALSMQGQGQNQSQVCQKPCLSEKTVTTKDCGGTVQVDEHHCYTIRTTVTTVKKIEMISDWTTGQECEKDYPCEKEDLPSCKEELPWVQLPQSKGSNQTKSLKTTTCSKERPVKTTKTTVCRHNEKVYRVTTTTKTNYSCEEWDTYHEEKIPEECQQQQPCGKKSSSKRKSKG